LASHGPVHTNPVLCSAVLGISYINLRRPHALRYQIKKKKFVLCSSKCDTYHTADLVCRLYSHDDDDDDDDDDDNDKDDMMTDSDDSNKM